MKNLLITACALFLSFFMQAQEITENKFGKGLINVVAKDSSFSANFALRFQNLFTSEWQIPEGGDIQEMESNFLIRRARMKLDGFAYTPKLKYKFQVGLSNRDIGRASQYTNNAPGLVLDAVLKWNFHENFELWAGQAMLPGNRERSVSSGNLETVDRSLVNSRFNIDRDMGLQLHHEIKAGEKFLIREALAFSQGEGRNVTAGNLGGYQYTARVEALPFGDFADYSGADLKKEQTPKLALGISYDYNDNAVRERSNSGSYMVNDLGFHETGISTLFLDAMFKYKGLSVMAEYAKRDAEHPIAVNSDGTPTGDVVNVGHGYVFQTGYVFSGNWQLLGRYTYVDLEEIVSTTNEKQYTLGLSKYIVGHKLKVQTDISYNDFNDGRNDGLLYRLQFDIHF